MKKIFLLVALALCTSLFVGHFAAAPAAAQCQWHNGVPFGHGCEVYDASAQVVDPSNIPPGGQYFPRPDGSAQVSVYTEANGLTCQFDSDCGYTTTVGACWQGATKNFCRTVATHAHAGLVAEQTRAREAATSASAPPTSAPAPAASPSPVSGPSTAEDCVFGYTARLWFLRWSNSGTICIGGR